jgi:hypothetical protein
MKVVIWGYPLHTHTHSYIHYGWHKAFSYLGYETLWLPDEPTQLVLENCLFITEGYTDKYIPLHPSNIYIVHVAVSIAKYLAAQCTAIDMRYNTYFLHDDNYSYNLLEKVHHNKVQQISSITWFEATSSNNDMHPRHHTTPPLTYPAFYTAWATDLLPHEFNDDIENFPVQPKMFFAGSVSQSNHKEYQTLVNACEKRGITVTRTDPWKDPVSFEDNRRLIQESILCPDIRGSGDPNRIARGEDGTCHKANGYIPCRLFKNISYGKLGATNSARMRDLFGEDLIVYEDEEEKLVERCLEKATDYTLIKRQMQFVATKHTYLNRVSDLLKVVEMVVKEDSTKGYVLV